MTIGFAFFRDLLHKILVQEKENSDE